MLSVPEALARILTEARLFGTETVPLRAARGRFSAGIVRSPVAVPPWDNSAVDGYAVKLADLATVPAVLKLSGTVGAGSVASGPLVAGQTWAVMTGAPVPDGTEAMVMVEDSEPRPGGAVALLTQVPAGNHLRRRGEDLAVGDELVGVGQRLDPARLGLLSSVGLTEVLVFRRPRVAVFSTGDEVVAPGLPLGPGQIWSSNNATLVGLIEEAGGEAVDLGIIGDRLEDLVAALDRALEADLVLSTGGVSVGEFDFVKDALAQVGVGAGFWKVAMRPGKPLAFGSAERGGRKVVVFGLPGNPVSCAVGFLEFVLPFLQAGFGAAPQGLPVVEVIAGEAFRQRPGRTGFERVRLSVEGSVIKAFKAGNPSSGALSGLARADGLLVLPLASSGVEAGDRAEVQVLRPEALARSVAT